MSVLMWWSLAFRALERKEVVGVLHGCVVGVLVAFSVWELCAFGEDTWRKVWRWGLFVLVGLILSVLF